MKLTKLNKLNLAAMLLLASNHALASGLTKGTTLLTTISTWMTGIGVTVVTIALMVVGFKMVFQAAEWKDVAPVFWGGVLIGSASVIASMFINGS